MSTCSDMYTRLRGLHLGTNFEPTALLRSNRFFDRCFRLFFGFSFVFIVFVVFVVIVAFVDFVVFAFGTTLTGSGSDGRGVLEGVFQALVGTGKMDQNGSKWINSKSQIQNCDV